MKKPINGRANVLRTISASVFGGRSPEKIQKLIALIAAIPPSEAWQKEALLDGANTAANSKAKLLRKPIRLPEEPKVLTSLAAKETNKVKDNTTATLKWLVWNGKSGYTPPPPPLSPAQQSHFEHGGKVYTETCAKCHQPDGLGRDGVASGLIDSEWGLGSDKRMARGILVGIQGPITVDGRTYSLEMPSLRNLSDLDIAGTMTYARRNWDHESAPVDPALVAAIRRETSTWTQPYSAKELQGLTKNILHCV